MKKIANYIKHHKIKTILFVLLLIVYAFCLPKTLFKNPTSTVITSKNNELLGALIADDGQWRFPQNDSIPEKFRICLLQFEDEYFYKHVGFNPISIFKALKENIASGKVIRGGSTITQQVIRLSRNNSNRTYVEKLKELVLATRLELRYSKNKILSLWASNAPFGGNVVGLDAASWRYFNRKAANLSWAESATLAVLPNAPSLIYPGKNQQKLVEKRNRLLKKLFDKEIIDTLTYTLSIAEEIPEKPFALPQITPHLLQRIAKTNKGKYQKTTIDKHLQEQVNLIVSKRYNELKKNEIHNISVLVLDVKTRQVLTYVGNSPTDNKHQKDVDIIDKPRSTGSVLKPFLYAAMLDSGDILPNTLVADVPTQFGNYSPENFNREYGGAIPASLALSRSLNVPIVRMLQDFGLDKFYHYLNKLQLKDINRGAENYGLSLVLGGAESNLWDLCKTYAAFSSTVNHYNESLGLYYENEFSEPVFLEHQTVDFGKSSKSKTLFDAASMYLTLESLKKVNRPTSNENWEFFDSSKEIAWKTGTSFGFRDAWAIGTTKDYVVGVWVGNADGEGRPGLVGLYAAAPILFDVFNILPKTDWFSLPINATEEIEVCKESGYRASQFCTEKVFEYVPKIGLKTTPCPYHFLVHLDATEKFQVNSSCENPENIVHKEWFVLPPLMEYYYKKKHPLYKNLPKFKPDCIGENRNFMEFIYPKKITTVFLPRDFDGNKNELILKVAHSNPESSIFWYLNSQYLGKTNQFHEMPIVVDKGTYTITVVDAFGNEIKRQITVGN